jgi:hypothetical protein
MIEVGADDRNMAEEAFAGSGGRNDPRFVE